MVVEREDYNELRVNVGWIDSDDESAAFTQNQETYAKIEPLFSVVPRGTKAVVTAMSGGRYGRRFKVVSNPLGLKDDLLALYASGGNLGYGYEIERGIITIKSS